MPIPKYECKFCGYLSTDFDDATRCEEAPFLRDVKSGEIYVIDNMVRLLNSLWYRKGMKDLDKIREKLTDFGDWLFRDGDKHPLMYEETSPDNIRAAVVIDLEQKVIRYTDEKGKLWHVRDCAHLFFAVDPKTRNLDLSYTGLINLRSLSHGVFQGNVSQPPNPIIQRHYRNLDPIEYQVVIQALDQFGQYSDENIDEMYTLKMHKLNVPAREGLKGLLKNIKAAPEFGIEFCIGKL